MYDAEISGLKAHLKKKASLELHESIIQYNKEKEEREKAFNLRILNEKFVFSQSEHSTKEHTEFEKAKAKEVTIFKINEQIKYLRFLQTTIGMQSEMRREDYEKQIIELATQLNNLQNTTDSSGGNILGFLGFEKGAEPFDVLMKKIGLGADQIQMLNSLFAQATQTMNEYFDNEINRYNEVISKSQERIDALENELKTEQERHDKGAASFIAGKRKELEEQKKINAQALREQKKVAKRKKRLELVTANLQIASAIIKALNTAPPYNFILAGIVSALGAIQLSNIAASKYAEGTEYVELDGNKPGRDTIPAMLDEGERVIPTVENNKIPRSFPNHLIPHAVKMYQQDNSGYSIHNNIINTGKLERQGEAANRLLKEIANKPENVYKDGHLYKEVVNNKITIYV